MKDKIVQLMKSEGLTSSRFAEILEIQPSGVSHLVSGRNKPGFDLLQKILRCFPNINPYWLILDDKDMYRREPEPPTPTPLPVEPLPRVVVSKPEPVEELPPMYNNKQSTTPNPPSPAPAIHPPLGASLGSKIDLALPRVKRVIILYDDDTCETYSVK